MAKASEKKKAYDTAYRKAHGSDNANRKRARRVMEKAGKVTKGDGKDVHHKDHNTANNKKSNLMVTTKAKNRADNKKPVKRRVKKPVKKPVKRRSK